MATIRFMHSSPCPRKPCLLEVTYDETNQQWRLHVEDFNSIAIVRRVRPSTDAAEVLTITDFGRPSSAVLEFAFPSGEVIRQEFATRSGTERRSVSAEIEGIDDAASIMIAD